MEPGPWTKHPSTTNPNYTLWVLGQFYNTEIFKKVDLSCRQFDRCLLVNGCLMVPQFFPS
ncbi:hypothetical protein EXN66_Car012000 [Channa argus]|uniref:Uncharacterized protein n=1 Tax=Channa argus TaxID=215402 RepID=A0A6G1Q1R7_CHAAH|nr:hypothetical protein EXN66_Car012000 [Channa argus]